MNAISQAQHPAVAMRFVDQLRCLLGCALGLAVTIAPAFLAPFGVLAKPMGDEFGWSRTALLVAVTITSAGGVLLTPIAGLVLDRTGPRPIAWTAALTLPCAVALQAAVPADYRVFLTATIALALISASAHPTVYLSVIARCFHRRLGLAIALAMAGLGIGQATTGIFAHLFLEQFGWRGAWIGIAALIGLAGLSAVLIVPWSALPPLPTKNTTTPRAIIWPVLVKTRLFWTLTIALLLVLMVAAGTALNLVSALRDNGVSGLEAASVAAMIPIFAIVGRLITGALVDRFSYVAIGSAFFVAQAIGCVLLLIATSLPAISAAVALIGLGYGADSDLLPYVIRKRFGVTHFGSIFGLMSGCVQIAVMIGPLLGGVVFQYAGSYSPMFAGFIVASLTAAGLWVFAPRLPTPKL